MTKELFCQVMVELGRGQPFAPTVPATSRANSMEVAVE